MRKLILPMCAFFLVFGTAAAAEVNTNINGSVRWGGPAVVPASSLNREGNGNEGHPMPFNPGGPMRPASSTDPRGEMWGHSSSTSGMWHGSSTAPMMGMGLPGTVATVGSSSFTIMAPFGKNHATTTITVNVTASTTYSHASSTLSFKDVTVGSHVLVLGKVSTSTQSVTAERVFIVGDMPSKAKDGIGGFIDRIKNFFKGNHDEIKLHASTSSAAAVESDGVVGKVLHALFGWL